jgi:hypothetical protein
MVTPVYLLRNCSTISPSVCTNVHSHQQHMSVPYLYQLSRVLVHFFPYVGDGTQVSHMLGKCSTMNYTCELHL